MVEALTVSEVYRACPEEALGFEVTSELESLDLLSGHARAREALAFGTSIRSDGFNLFVLGQPGHGKHSLVGRYLVDRSRNESPPPDWCYLYNFEDPSVPLYLQLPPGTGRQLRRDIEGLVEELRGAIPAVFESDEYQNRLQELKQAMGERQRDAIEAVRREAREQGILLLSTPNGFTFAPADDDKMMSPDDYEKLPKEERDRIEHTVEILQRKLTQAIRRMPRLAKELREQINQLNEEVMQSAIGSPLGELEERYAEEEGVIAHVAAIREAILQHVDAFLSDEPEIPPEAVFSRFHLNLLVDNADTEGAPVIYQDLPGHQHLVGRIEHHVHNGTLLTDFSLIRAGALHRANGGYLVLDVRGVLTQPGAWETLKRILRAGEIRTESLEQAYGLISTVSLEPQPIPLDVKIVLLGERLLYYLLCEHDPEFLELFKVMVDLEDELPRNEESLALYARMVATLAREAALRPLDRSGVAATIERASRLADDQQRLTARHRDLSDLLLEADHWAGQEDTAVITRAHVEKAVQQQLWRAGRIRERSHEHITRGTVMIATEGSVVGQVNGLSVLALGDYAFGQPTRITATARPGSGQVVDIEREAKLGGRIHSKAVMILSRYLAGRYSRERPMSISASLAFEQSYGGIEGDSASVAEVCALVSAIARVGLDQRFAVTGSINQHGEVQAVGGVNEKVEGFFDVCRVRGELAGQAVILPAANVEHLMLKGEVREAMAAGHFHLYGIRHVDEALALLTGQVPGEPDEAGNFPAESLNGRVQARLEAFRDAVKAARGSNDEEVGEGDRAESAGEGNDDR
ncbi:lon-related putative ATP-dependent protease [Halomonas campaniensis]|uniref:endopeptidase La n=1 Tax=Halomonas campaniensis TaxID=213554 RepID=A0A7W5K320_9GAMM|nr:ATP-binding protein [Halomonas campaniensis]MBB3330963.1 lon-related putative ATP-dependent protease [Halomonas campaniensis]